MSMYVIRTQAEEETLNHVEELDNLSVTLEINEESDLPTRRCANCGDEANDDTSEDPCDGSGNFIDCAEHMLDAEGDCESCDGSGEIEIHEWEEIPLHWCNSASIHADPDRDRIYVTISVRDPRGAFVMTVENIDGQLYLSVPHEGMSMPHAPLTRKSAGWYKIN